MKHEHIQEAARDAKQMEENSILGGDPLLETCTCTSVETEYSQMCDYCQSLEKAHPGYFAGLIPSWTGTNSREGDGHDSDCATHDAPAYPVGECDCSLLINVEPDAWASKIMCVGPEYGKTRYGKLPVQGLQPGYYSHEKLYSEKTVIGSIKSAKCTNTDTWNCKYCKKVKSCEANKDCGFPPREDSPHWRDVVDGLPQEAQEVLFVRGDKVLYGAWIDGNFWHSNKRMAAVYWMPIPKPPVNLCFDEIKPRIVFEPVSKDEYEVGES